MVVKRRKRRCKREVVKRRGGGMEDKGRRDQPSHVMMEAISHLCGCGARGGEGGVAGSVRV